MPGFESCFRQLLALEQQVQMPQGRNVAGCRGTAKRLTWLEWSGPSRRVAGSGVEWTEQESCRILSPMHPQEEALTETTMGNVSPTCDWSWVTHMRSVGPWNPLWGPWLVAWDEKIFKIYEQRKVWSDLLYSAEFILAISQNWSHLFMANRWGKSWSSDRFYFLGLQSHCGRWPQPWN